DVVHERPAADGHPKRGRARSRRLAVTTSHDDLAPPEIGAAGKVGDDVHAVVAPGRQHRRRQPPVEPPAGAHRDRHVPARRAGRGAGRGGARLAAPPRRLSATPGPTATSRPRSSPPTGPPAAPTTYTASGAGRSASGGSVRSRSMPATDIPRAARALTPPATPAPTRPPARPPDLPAATA